MTSLKSTFFLPNAPSFFKITRFLTESTNITKHFSKETRLK